MRVTETQQLEDLQSVIPAYTPGENPPTIVGRRRTCDLLSAKRYVTSCILSSAGYIQGYPAVRAIQQAASKEELIAQLDAVCSALAPYLRAVFIGRVVDRTLVLLGEAG
jgi:hypothetical protein